MNLRQVVGKSRRATDAELNITPVMNIFVILIPFLLLTATFVKIAIIEFSLPSLQQKGNVNLQDLKNLTVLVVGIKPEGFEIKTSERTYPLIGNRDGRFDYASLYARLKEIKDRYPDLKDVIISPAPNIRYQIIVKVLDNCREVGFPNFSISG